MHPCGFGFRGIGFISFIRSNFYRLGRSSVKNERRARPLPLSFLSNRVCITLRFDIRDMWFNKKLIQGHGFNVGDLTHFMTQFSLKFNFMVKLIMKLISGIRVFVSVQFMGIFKRQNLKRKKISR